MAITGISSHINHFTLLLCLNNGRRGHHLGIKVIGQVGGNEKTKTNKNQITVLSSGWWLFV